MTSTSMWRDDTVYFRTLESLGQGSRSHARLTY